MNFKIGGGINMEIKDGGGSNGIVVEWSLRGITKRRTAKKRGGMRSLIQATTISLPHDLVSLISNDGKSTYMYEHFEKI